LTIIANTIYHHGGVLGLKTFWQFYGWYSYFFKANGFAAIITNKMHMVIVVVACLAIIFTQSV
jgi:hypothetical protein